jgi:hypothetical protein
MDKTEKSNKLIANFMGYFPNDKKNGEPPMYEFTGEFSQNGFSHSVHPSCLLFNSSWDWLIPVIQKILNISFSDNGNSEDFYNIRDCIPDINHTYKAVVQFIEEYNKSENELS